jgi:hypothetical protein
MDTIISRMMRLLGVIVVGGYVTSGLMTAQLQDWGGCIAFLVFGTIFACGYTAIWTCGTYQILDQIGKGKKRSDVTKQSIVGLSIGVLALLISAGFVTAGIAATNGTDNTYSLWLEFLGAAATCALAGGWCMADYYFVGNQK